MPPPLFEAKSISKSFGAFKANDSVDMTIEAGSIHALLGENGAGKSTFVKMLYGIMPPDDGAFFWHGKRCHIASPGAARTMGIAMVFQHFSLFPALSVAENIALALGSAGRPADLHRKITEAAERWGLAINPRHIVGALSAGEQQRVEILRCLLQNPQLLIMDEPTSVLTPQEAVQLFESLRRLADDGCATLYISHKLDEIMALADEATILRHGRNAGSVTPAKSSPAKMAELMIGRTLDAIGRRPAEAKKPAPILMQISDLSRPPATAFSTALNAISLDVRRGEIIGIAGISGNGQNALVEALSGEWRCPSRPQMIRLEGRPIGHLPPAGRRRLGIETVPEERHGHAAIGGMTLTDNTFLTRHSCYDEGRAGLRRFFVNPRTARAEAMQITADNDVRIAHDNPLAGQLSGGNLQKFIIGRMLIAAPRVAIIHQPTWGVDVGAGRAIHRRLLALAEGGCGIILISQDLDEILTLSQRIGILHQGRLTPLEEVGSMTAEKIGLAMGGSGDVGDADNASDADSKAGDAA